MSLLSLERINKTYPDGRGKLVVLDDVSLDVEPEEVLGVWGLRRSGKSTLLRVAAGIESPDSGELRFGGIEIGSVSQDRRAQLQRNGGMGLLGSDWRPERNKAAIEHVALPLLSEGLSLREARGPAWRALKRAQVADCGHLPAERLSQSERVRVALAQLLVREPRMLLVDDPAVLLKPSEGVELYELLRSIAREAGIALVIASEDIAPLRRAPRIMSIDRGKLRAMDDMGTLVPFPDRLTGRQQAQP
jgi:predicted ABC-type transport system involved in lysophospholipase L1 biosynthesis ATPase subunit